MKIQKKFRTMNQSKTTITTTYSNMEEIQTTKDNH